MLLPIWADRSDLFASLAELPEAGRRLLNTYASLAAELGQDTSVDRFYWLGSGSRYGLACELSLKVKEMSLSQSEPFHFMEFRHGPKSMVAPSALVVGLHSATQHEPEASVLADVRSLGGRVLSMGWDGDQVAFGDHLEEAACNVLHLPVGQLIAWERATSRGLDPDRPTNLEAVVKLG